MAYQLYDYQQELVTKAQRSYLNGYKAPCIVLGCGGGKSIIIAEIIRQSTLKGNRVLFLVHRKELKDQITQTLKNNDVDMSKVYVGMVQTVVRRLDKLKQPQLIVIDENHHTLARSYRKIIDYFNTYIIGFTATPIRLNGDGLGDVNDVLVEGPSVKWLIENKRLSPYEYYSIDLTNKDKLKKSSTGDYTNDSMDKSLGNTIYGDVIKHYRELIDGQKTILYAHSVEYSQMYAEKFNKAGIPAAHIDAKTSKTDRDTIIQNFREGKILVLCNVDILGEGFDVPDCTAVMLLRPTASLSLHVQQSMRPMRYQTNKSATIIDHVGNVYRHGLPDDERKWSLEGKHRNTNEDELKIKQCPVCGKVVLANVKQCDKCEHKFAEEKEPSQKEIDEQAELKLVEQAEIKKRRLKNKHWKKASSYQELLEMADAKEYKRSWAAFKAYELDLEDTPSWVIEIKEKQEQDAVNYELNFSNRFY